MSDAELAYMMTDSNESFDLPRWQTHIDPLSSTGQAAHSAQASYYGSSAPPPAASGHQSAVSPVSPHRMNPPPSTGARQPRISQLLEQDQPMSTGYLSSSQSLSRSASLNSNPGGNSTSKARRHHQPEDLENPYGMDSARGAYYQSSGDYQQQSLPVSNSSPPTSSSDPYSNTMFYQSQSANVDATERNNRSPMAMSQTPTVASNLDSYAHQSPYSPPGPTTNNYGTNSPYSSSSAPSYSFGSPEHRPTYTHSRNHSQNVIKTESMSPPMVSSYTPQGAPGYTSPYDHSGSGHLTAQQSPVRKTTTSKPPTPLSYLPSHSPAHYYPQDQTMNVDPPPKRRPIGFRRVRGHQDLQPKADVPAEGRRMSGDGSYLSPLRQLTTNILDTYRICNPQFRYESTHNPRRVLTKPSKPAHNEGYDNDDYDYILYVNDWLGTEDGHKYLILDILGQGTFGQVVKCQNMKTHEIVAVKVVKNKPAYFNQSMMEVTILEMLNKQLDPADAHHILRLKDSFIHRSHLCLVFELLSSNLYELIKQNQFQGLSTQLVKVFMAQLLDALTVLKDARLIHCDLKPENILLKTLQSPQIKVIDFGSACHEKQTVYTYIQSRFYRSPEVLLGMPYTASIDMWSMGCIAVELFLGLPLFPGTSEYNQLTRIVEMLGNPPNSMLNTGKQTHQFFDARESYNPQTNMNEKKYSLKSLETYSREHGTNEQPGKQYFKATTLPDIINTAPMPATKSSRAQQEIDKEINNRASFIDFCKGLLDMNPVTRWTPQQARQHPFITGEKFSKPFVPDGRMPQPQPAAANGDPKRPYGGLVPSQPKGTRAYQDAATYNQHLAQHQVHQAQAQNQAANTFRNNPYITPQTQQQSPSQAQAQQSPAGYSGYAEVSPPYPQAQTYQGQSQGVQQSHRLVHQASTGQLPSSSSMPQYSNQSMTGAGTHLGTNNPQYFQSSSRSRSNTINPQDGAVPPALARLQHMNQDVIAGRNALTPVLNRDDAMREWERRQSGKAAAAQPYPQLEYLQQQAEMAAAQGVTNWTATNSRYMPPTSKLAHSYQPPLVEDDGRREAVMSNVRSAARGDPSMYGASGVIASPPQTYTSNNTTTGNRYAMTYPQQQQQQQVAQQGGGAGAEMSNYVPMQPEQYSMYPASTGVPNASARNVAPPQQSVPPSFYGSAGNGHRWTESK